MKDIFKTISQGIGILFFVVTPLLWLGITIDAAGWPKNILIVSLSLILALCFALDLLATRRGIKLASTPFTWPLVLLAVSFLIASVFSPNKIEAVVLPMGAATVFALVITFLLLTGPLWKENRWFLKLASLAFGAGAILAGAISFLSLLPEAPFPLRPFITTGPALALLPYLAVCFLGGLAYLTSTLISGHHESLKTKLTVGTVAGLSGLLLVLNLWKLWPVRVQFFTFLPYWGGWQIAAETLKVSPLWGRGPTNFLTAFTTGRPTGLNSDPLLWNVRFFVSSNFPFHLAATVGLLGLAAYGYLMLEIGRTVVKLRKKLIGPGWGLATLVVAAAAVQLLLPPTLITWWLLLAALILFTVYLRTANSELIETKEAGSSRFADEAGGVLADLAQEPIGQELAKPRARAILSIVVGLILILAIIPAGYFTARFSTAEITYKKGVDAAVAGNGPESLSFILKSITLNPWVDTYHLGDSQIQLAMANLLAIKGKDLSEADRKMAVQYVQQAIQEGKKATEVSPFKVTNWEILGALYRNLFNLATGADRFALAALSQAIILDPTNPNLRLNQGGTYYSLGDFDNAIVSFKQAISLKPDWANAHYNLAAAFREKKDYKDAADELEKTLALVPPGSNDAAKASAELDALKQALAGGAAKTVSQSSATASQSAVPKTLEKPTPVPTPIIRPPLKIGSESGLPASLSSGSASPTAQPTSR